MSFSFDVKGCGTKVLAETGLLRVIGSQIGQSLQLAQGAKVVLVTDSNVNSLFAEPALESLKSAGINAYRVVIAPGEESKSLKTLSGIFEYFAENGINRESVVLALGGGVVSDLAGFAAATWMRGVRFVICPTTMESVLDACLGGKTAINLPSGKNLIGAFHQPSLICVDPLCLETLNPRDIRAGLAESMKHALLDSDEFLSWHEENVDPILQLDPATIMELIYRNLKFKASVVSEDLDDRSDHRAILNLGHTIGHAIESCCGYAYRHGECVGFGLLVECAIAERECGLDPAVGQRLRRLIQRLGLPERVASPIDLEQVLAAMQKDKKNSGGSIRFVLLRAIGQPVLWSSDSETKVRKALDGIHSIAS